MRKPISAGAKSAPAPARARPPEGGSYVRDRRTGALTRVPPPAEEAPPAEDTPPADTPPATGQEG